jgi:hypothetical protein
VDWVARRLGAIVVLLGLGLVWALSFARADRIPSQRARAEGPGLLRVGLRVWTDKLSPTLVATSGQRCLWGGSRPNAGGCHPQCSSIVTVGLGLHSHPWGSPGMGDCILVGFSIGDIRPQSGSIRALRPNDKTRFRHFLFFRVSSMGCRGALRFVKHRNCPSHDWSLSRSTRP